MGSDYRIYQITKALAKDFDVFFAVFPPLRALGNIVDNSLKAYLANREKTELPENFKAKYLKLPIFLYHLWAKLKILAYVLTLIVFFGKTIRLLKSIRPDVVVAAHPSYHCGLVGTLAAKILHIPVVLDYPDLWTPMTMETLSWQKGNIKSVVLDVIESIPVRLASHIVVVTNAIKDKVVRMGISNSKVTLVPNGVSPNELLLSSDALIEINPLLNKNVILFSGRLERWSGLEYFLESIPYVLKTEPNNVFVIVGDGSHRKFLERKVFSTNIKKHVIFTGFLNREKVWNLIRKANVCVSIFAEGATSNAAIPIKLLEYMALGKPIVTTECKGLNDFLRDKENVFLTKLDAESIASAITCILQDESLARTIGLNAQRLVKEFFDWEILSLNFRKICYSVLALQNCINPEECNLSHLS